ncbi:MAG: preprotein translocase subunit SecG [Patescibacteria group bacterium]
MGTTITILQILISIALVVLILLQERGGGAGGIFGGGGGGGFYQARRGIEKIIFTSTIILTIVFVLLAFISLFIA